MRIRILMLCGVLAPTVYAVTVVLGGILRPDYSHISQFVSELIAAGAPNKTLLDPLFALYNLLTIAFGLGLVMTVRAASEMRKVSGTLSALVLVVEGVFGFVTVFFPQDPVGAPITSTGTMHIILAGLSSLTTMLSMLLLGLWFRKQPGLQSYGLYSFISVAFVFIFGGLAAVTGANRSPILGITERLTIGAFLQWLFVIALKLYSSREMVAAPTR
jgi:hypothetical membrane protein